MDDLWALGMRHFLRRNYYAAKDCWSLLYTSTDNLSLKIRAYNAVGTAVTYLYGPKEGIPYFEKAIRLLKQQNPSDPLIVRYLGNLALMSMHTDERDTAIHNARTSYHTAQLDGPNVDFPSVNLCMQVLNRYELQGEALAREAELVRCLERVRADGSGSNYDIAYAYHCLGRSYQYSQKDETALEYYEIAAGIHEIPATMQEISRISLFRGDVERAVEYANRLIATLWYTEPSVQKLDLADTLSLVGTFAFYAGQESLARACFEKAELYYGQLLHWRLWLWIQNLESTLRETSVTVPRTALNWDAWRTFLDELSLLDGIETMFPQLYHWSEVASHLTVRIAKRVLTDFEEIWPFARIATRLVYLGLTALASTETEGKSILTNRDQQMQVCHYGARLLEAYPHTEGNYRELVRCYRTGLSGKSAEPWSMLAQCIGIAVDFVETVETKNMTHQEAVSSILGNPRDWYSPSVLDAFRKETMLED